MQRAKERKKFWILHTKHAQDPIRNTTGFEVEKRIDAVRIRLIAQCLQASTRCQELFHF